MRRTAGGVGLLAVVAWLGAWGPLGVAPAAAEAIKIGATSRSMIFFPLFAAQKKGFFEAEGLQVEIPVFGSSSKATQALISDSIQFGHTNPENVFRVNPRGAGLKIIGGLTNAPTFSIVAQAKYKKVADLKGARMAVTNIRTGLGTMFTFVMEKNGLKYPGDYALVEVPGTPDIWRSIERGAVDGGIVSWPFNFVAQDKGFTVLADVPDFLPEYQFNAIQVRADWAAKNRDVVVRYLKAYLRTTRWFHDNRDEAVALIQELVKLDPKNAARAWEFWTSKKVLPRDGRATVAGLKANQDLLRQRGETGLDASVEPYLDESFLAEAQRQLGGT